MSKDTPTSSRQRFSMAAVRQLITKNAIALVLLVLVLAIGIIRPSFLGGGNLLDILRVSSVRLLIALGVTGILITGGTDLSAGRTVGLACVIAASLAQRPDYASKIFPNLPQLSIIIPILAAMAAGCLVGFMNGLIVAFLNVPAFIATLGTMIIVYGAASLYVDHPPLGAAPIGGLKDSFTNLGSGTIGFGHFSIPIIIVIAFGAFLIYSFLLNRTTLGKNIYAIGGNANAATVSGVNVRKNLVIIYTIAGVLYGLAGVLLSARTGGATNEYASGYELDAIAAAVIGGVSITGGVGTATNAVIGVLIFEVLNNGLVVLGVSAYWQLVIKGVIIVSAVALDIRKYTRKR
jgi:methyl-galactoside transport system permease protein